jgi:hypothetical protein
MNKEVMTPGFLGLRFGLALFRRDRAIEEAYFHSHPVIQKAFQDQGPQILETWVVVEKGER